MSAISLYLTCEFKRIECKEVTAETSVRRKFELNKATNILNPGIILRLNYSFPD
jgi:hypothetical protein